VCYPSIVNIGFSPSVVEGGCRRVEVHIIGFDADIYGQTIAVELVEFLRPECKFPSREALVDQIRKDVATATDKLKIES
jgi:riboflavin kinase/FMN adenylyltransferase